MAILAIKLEEEGQGKNSKRVLGQGWGSDRADEAGKRMGHPEGYGTGDFNHSPFLVFYEVTRACDLACRHCRASAQPKSNPHELNTALAKELIVKLKGFPKPPLLVFTGGDPFKRPDLFELVEDAARLGLEWAMTPSATPLVTADALKRLKEFGVSRLAMSLDGADAATHDAFRGVPGSFELTRRILADARACALPLQINTTITKRNVDQVGAMAELAEKEGISLWSVFFLIPVGRGKQEERIAAEGYEKIFELLWEEAGKRPYAIKTTEAHHYRRFVLQRAGDPRFAPHAAPDRGGKPLRAPLGVNDGKGVMFVSHTGLIYPAGFLPIRCGRFPEDSVVKTYQESPLFRQLRNPDQFKGKCGICPYRKVCGGSRARAFAVFGDPLGPEPDCVYQPEGWKEPGKGKESCEPLGMGGSGP